MERNVLIVEDQKTFRDNLSALIADENTAVNTAEDGFDALKMLKERFYDIIICDIEMPKMGGIELLKIIKRTEKYSAVVMLTSREDSETIDRAFAVGADDYLVKGNLSKQVSLIRAKIRKALTDVENRQLLDELKVLKENNLLMQGSNFNANSGDSLVKNVLVLDDRKGLVNNVLRSLRSSGMRVEGANVEDDAEKLISGGFVPDLVVTNLSNIGFLEDLDMKYDTYKILLADESIEPHFGRLVTLKNLGNIVSQRDMVDFFGSVNEVLNTSYKLSNPTDLFGLDKYIKSYTPPVEIMVKDTSKRQEAIDQVLNFARSLGCRNRFLNSIQEVLEEFLMNAMYDAPVDKDGNSKYDTLNRTKKVILEEWEVPVLSYACNGETIGVSVRDPFGRFKKETLFRYLQKCFAMGANQIDTKDGGAGLGLYKIYKATNSFIINVKEGECTEVMCLFDLNIRTQKRKGSLHFFTVPNE